MKELSINNNNGIENINNKYEEGLKKIPETTSKELIESFQYYDKIKNNIYNKDEIQDIKNHIYKGNNKKIVIYSINSNENKDKFSNKAKSLNLNFNNINKNNNQKGNNLKISLNSINNMNKKNGEIKKKNELKLLLNKNNNNDLNNNKLEENKKQENSIDNNINNNEINASNSENNKLDKNNENIEYNKNDDNNIISNSNSNNVNKENSLDDKYIECKYISIISLVDKESSYSKNKNNFNIGNYLFKIMNPFNLNLLINSLKNNDKYSISNFKNSIILSSPEEIQNNFNFINTQSNNILDINSLESILNEKNLYLSEDNNESSIKYAFLSSLININFISLLSSSIIYNQFYYNCIKIYSSKNIISIEDDIIIYTIPTNDDNILIYICPYNEKIKEIIKKYDKNNNLFNGFSNFVNLISLYFEDNNNNYSNERKILVPCFEIDTQLICSKIPGYNKINIKDNNNNKEMDIFEYDEIIKINMKPKLNKENKDNLNINENEDIIIDDDFLFGIYHKEMKNKYNTPFISLNYIGKDNFIQEK